MNVNINKKEINKQSTTLTYLITNSINICIACKMLSETKYGRKDENFII